MKVPVLVAAGALFVGSGIPFERIGGEGGSVRFLTARPATLAQEVQARRDQPWTPTDTGTVRPGMSRDEVVAVWGSPITERTVGAWSYMYYRNGCEYSCGTHDIVFLENGQVVNAIVRGRGHTYAGMSSSPPGQTPQFTPRRPNQME